MSGTLRSGGIFDFEGKRDKLAELELELSEADLWNDPHRAQQLNKERSQLDRIVSVLSTLEENLQDLSELAELTAQDRDATARPG